MSITQRIVAGQPSPFGDLWTDEDAKNPDIWGQTPQTSKGKSIAFAANPEQVERKRRTADGTLWTSERIGDLVTRSGLTASAFSERYAFTKTAVARWINGQNQPGIKHMERLDEIERELNR